MAFLPWVSSLNTMGNVEASVSPILQCLLKQTYNTTTSVPKKQKKKKNNIQRQRERVVVEYQEEESGSVPWLGLPWLWLYGCWVSLLFQIFYSFYFWSQRKKIRDFLGENGSNYTKLKIYSSINTWGSFIVHFYFLMRNSIR